MGLDRGIGVGFGVKGFGAKRVVTKCFGAKGLRDKGFGAAKGVVAKCFGTKGLKGFEAKGVGAKSLKFRLVIFKLELWSC